MCAFRLQGDFTFSALGDKTHSTDFSSGKSDSECDIPLLTYTHTSDTVHIIYPQSLAYLLVISKRNKDDNVAMKFESTAAVVLTTFN